MQISDLNTNLLKALTGQSSVKGEGRDGESSFIDLLYQSDSLRENKAEPVAARQVARTDARVDVKKESTAPASREESKEPQKKNDVNQKKEDVKKPASEKEAEKDTPKVLKEETAEIIVPVDAVETTVTPEDMVEEILVAAPAVVEDLPVVDEVVAETFAIDEELPAVSVVENQPVVAEVAEDIAELPVENADFEDVESETAVETQGGRERSENIVREQAAKIAEKIMPEERLEIKVDVREDKVTAAPEKAKIAPETLVFEEDKTELFAEAVVEEVEVAADNEAAEVNNFEPLKAPAVNLAQTPAVDKTAVVEAAVLQIAENTPAEVSVLAETAVQSVGAVASEMKPVAVSNDNSGLRQIYNTGLSKEVAEQVKVNITQSAIKGVDKIEIQLKPAALGDVEIKLHIGRDGRLQAHIAASNPETLEMLQKDLSSLKEAFNQAGYQADDGSFTFGYRGEDQNDNEREQLRQFIGEVIVKETAEELAANDYISVDGVNIRV